MTEVLRRLARDQWIRIHGTPRITVLVGAGAQKIWNEWLAVTALPGQLVEGELDRAVREAYALAIQAPERPVAIASEASTIARWRAGRDDRLAAMVDEGMLQIAVAVGRSVASPVTLDARSAAEAAMFEALEATPTTAGRFRLNESLSVVFGDRAAEVDLLSRGDGIAIEIDGYHHFNDAAAYRRDRRKDLLLQTQGLLVLRFLAEDVMRDPRDAVSTVVQALAYRRIS